VIALKRHPLRAATKPLKPLYRSAVLAALWSNRRDVGRWAKFAKRAADSMTRPRKDDLLLEAKVRASLSADPILRHDPSIRDVRVHNGVVVLETPPDWRNKGLAVTRLGSVNGVQSVHTAADVSEDNWLGVDLVEYSIPTAAPSA
jgi:hypothetical protein